MKLLIDNIEILIDFSYTQGTRPYRKKDKTSQVSRFHNSFEKVKENKLGVDTIITTCNITFTNFDNDVKKLYPVKVVADLDNHNKSFARKYAIKRFFERNQINDKNLRTKIWKAYWDYTKSQIQKDAYLSIDNFSFQNVDNEIFINFEDNTISKTITLTGEQKNLLLKLLK